MLNIRDAAAADIPSIQAIYAHHVLHGNASFETQPPNEAELRARYETILAAGYPYIVAELDGEVLGYAYASAYRARHAYRFSVEDSIYIRHGEAGKGVGKALLTALIDRCAARGFRLMVAAIGDSGNAASIGLHARCGFRMAGMLPSVGFKHGRWLDSVFMTLPLGEGDRSTPHPITSQPSQK